MGLTEPEACAIVFENLKEFIFFHIMAKENKVILACSECLSRNYTTPHRKNSTKRLELMKFCPKCNKKTLHKETK